jgi:DNA gyrase/topoisomerase IV subunit A
LAINLENILKWFCIHSDIVEHHQTSNSNDQRMDFEGLFSGDMCELSNIDTVSQVNPTEEDTTDQSQWPQQDDLNLDENTTTVALSDEARTKLDECQNELDRLNNEKENLDAQLAQMNNPVLRVNVNLSYLLIDNLLFHLESLLSKN